MNAKKGTVNNGSLYYVCCVFQASWKPGSLKTVTIPIWWTINIYCSFIATFFYIWKPADVFYVDVFPPSWTWPAITAVSKDSRNIILINVLISFHMLIFHLTQIKICARSRKSFVCLFAPLPSDSSCYCWLWSWTHSMRARDIIAFTVLSTTATSPESAVSIQVLLSLSSQNWISRCHCHSAGTTFLKMQNLAH